MRPLPLVHDDQPPAQVIGSDPLERQIRELGSDVHIFGHTHIPIDMTSDGVRYVQWPLGEHWYQFLCLRLLLRLRLENVARVMFLSSQGRSLVDKRVLVFLSLRSTRV